MEPPAFFRYDGPGSAGAMTDVSSDDLSGCATAAQAVTLQH